MAAVPPAARGRAIGIAMAGISAVQGLGALAAGAAADVVPAGTVVLVTGLAGLPLVVVPLLALLRTRAPAGRAVAGPSGT
ncbi:hypothetical protein ACFQX8_01750 [Klenkia terrae]|uniref:hypothetical protein n=1 Tax=Klenkia terrae TaxID=1052259 RepID=UPI003616B758